MIFTAKGLPNLGARLCMPLPLLAATELPEGAERPFLQEERLTEVVKQGGGRTCAIRRQFCRKSYIKSGRFRQLAQRQASTKSFNGRPGIGHRAQEGRKDWCWTSCGRRAARIARKILRRIPNTGFRARMTYPSRRPCPVYRPHGQALVGSS